MYPENPKISARARTESVDRAMAAYERFHQRMVALNSPVLVDMSLTLAQLKAIYVVAAAGSLTMGALSERLGTALSTTSGTVDRLVRRGLLERAEDPSDRRQVIVRATDDALEQIEHFSELSRARMRDLLLRLPTDADVETIERAIGLMTDAVAASSEETE
jgi:MarR family transcriptional regulator, organic hydroperoxide resistance regulator